MLLTHLLNEIKVASITGNPALRIEGVTFDSRRVAPGFLFVAIRGANTDGNLYLEEAVRRGAAAIATESEAAAGMGVTVLRVEDARRFLAEAAHAFYGKPSCVLRLTGITGTNGKTTSAYLLNAIFRCAGLNSCLIGTLGVWIREQHIQTGFTTPEAPELDSLLRRALDCGCTHGVMEVSSHALASKRVFGTRFDAAVFSNLTPEHLDYHGDMESYYRAKLLLFTEAGGNGTRHAFVNTDDPYGLRLSGEIDCPVTTYGRRPEAGIRLLMSRKGVDGTDLRVRTTAGDIELHSSLIGTPNIYNILSVVGVALRAGVGADFIRSGIESVRGVPGRMELIRAGQPFTIVIDYAHTPDALQKLLETIRELPHGRIITVFGCGGDRDRHKRPLMGEIAGSLSDLVLATSDNPRSEDPNQILAEIEPGLRRCKADFRLQADRRHAIYEALSAAARSDVVVIAGKGHEDYQILGTRVIPFDDRTVAREEWAKLQRQEGA